MKIDIEAANLAKQELEKMNTRLQGKAFGAVVIRLTDTGLVLELVDPDPDTWDVLQKRIYGIPLVKG